MDDQGDLFGGHGAYARASDPETSHAAAAQVDVGRREQQVLDAFKGRIGYGLTTHEIEDITGLAAGTVTPRMKQLELKGRVLRTEMTRVPPGHRTKQTIWCLRGVH